MYLVFIPMWDPYSCPCRSNLAYQPMYIEAGWKWWWRIHPIFGEQMQRQPFNDIQSLENGFAILLPSCHFSLFMLRSHIAFRNWFEERVAEVLQTLSNLRDRWTHHGSFNTVHIYLDSDGTTGWPHNELSDVWQFGLLTLELFIHPIHVELKKPDGLTISKSFERSMTCHASFVRFSTCQARTSVRW